MNLDHPPIHGTIALDSLRPDGTETGLLAVTRHLLVTLADPATQAWHLAFGIAAERWGQGEGPRIAMAAYALVAALARARTVPVRHCDPLSPEDRTRATPEEAALIGMIRAMQRDLTDEARRHVAALTGGRMDAAVIGAGLTLARALPRPATRPVMVAAHGGLGRLH
ncbi:hypothetical protein [Gemmobacter sp.]|uniref:hypothetical protein n=1 Tax=Gemmobacter sp. TaxID=1898957 RepID=UPI002AFF56EE|nr:hypothetical protein [Gemmobacter sp.]